MAAFAIAVITVTAPVAAAGDPASTAPASTTLPASVAPPATIDALAWMAGHWRNAEVEEVWLAPRAGLMLAMTREVRRGAAPGNAAESAVGASEAPRVSFEYLRIEQREGSLVLFASPGGRSPTPFALAELGPRRVRFANAAHDFPQVILYWREGESLRARVEGVVGGRKMGIDYAWTRAEPIRAP